MDDDDELDGEGGFEAELAMLDEVEADMRSIGEGPEAVSTSTRWSRPPVQSFSPTTDALVFQQFDVDFYSGIVSIYSTDTRVLARDLPDFNFKNPIIVAFGGIFVLKSGQCCLQENYILHSWSVCSAKSDSALYILY